MCNLNKACREWKKPLLPTVSKEVGNEQEQSVDRRGLVMSFIILLLSVPALIGAWCWPAIVIGLLSGVASAAARTLGHYISFGITLTMMVLVNIYIGYKSSKRKGRVLRKYGPLFCTLIAGCLIMLDLTRHCLADLKIWTATSYPIGSAEYRPGCTAQNITCLSVLGIFFTIIATYTGFIFLFIGTMWSANLLQKLKQIKQQWSVIRGKK